LIGKHFGSYKIEAKIGEGGMGVVYRARDIDLDRPVAIKMVRDTTVKPGSEGTEAVARFLREAKAASRLQHPAIVHIYKYGVQDDTRYLVMEFIEGKNLRAMINHRPLAPAKICELAVQIADGLGVAHEMGVVHRDLKLENIMVTTRGQVKILDFGLAKVVELPSAAEEATIDEDYKTQLGTVLGTVSSMSPEQALGRNVDAKADIFSLGVVLYEMATGLNPFLGPTPQATLSRILSHQPELVSLINPSIPPELERLVHLCLRKDPKQRPSAPEVTNACKRLLSTATQWASVAQQDASDTPGPVLIPALSESPKPIGTANFKPPSAARANVSPAPTNPAELRSLSFRYQMIRCFRILFALATITVPISFFVYLLVAAKVVRPEIVEGTAVWAYVQALVLPVLAEAEKIFTFRAVFNGWDLMIAGLGVVMLIVRHALMLPIDKLEFSAKTKLIRARSNPAQAGPVSVNDRAVNNRLALLREYAEGQRSPGKGKRLAVVSVDIVGWSRVIMGEDPLVVEHAFAEYKKFVDRALRNHRAQKTAFIAEDVISVFSNVDDAIAAAQSILSELPWFNDGVHRLRSSFHVRCGINVGELDLPAEKELRDLSSPVLDVALHMQQFAPPDTLWLSGEVLALASKSGGFEMVSSQEVDGRTTYEWRPVAVSPALRSSNPAIGAD